MFTFSFSHQTTCLGYLTNVLHFVAATPTVSMTCFPSSASASSCSSSSTSHLASPPVCSLFLLFLLFLCLHLINEAGLLSFCSFYHFVHAFFLSFFRLLYYVFSLCFCSNLLLRFSICVPKLWPPLLRRPLVFSSRTRLEGAAAARTRPPATQMTLSWCLLTSPVRKQRVLT